MNQHSTMLRRRSYLIICCGLAAIWALPTSAAWAEDSVALDVQGASIIEKPNAQVPLDLEFTDDQGQKVRLGDYFARGKPVLLTMAYCKCPYLCNQSLNGVVKAIKPSDLVSGTDYQIVTVDFDPREAFALAAAKKANYLKSLGKPDAHDSWHILTSDRPEAAKALGDAIGFGYKLDARGLQYLHGAGIFICAPDGRVARTIRGIEYDPVIVHDSLVQASEGKISSGLFGVAISCGLLSFNHDTGKYTWAIMAVVRLVCLLTVLMLGGVIGTLLYRERRGKTVETPGPC